MGPKPLILARAFGLGTGLALYVLPKRSVTALGRVYRVLQDLDARRKITTKTRRSRSNNNNYSLSPVTLFAVTSFDKKEILAPPLTPRGFFFGGLNRQCSAR